MDVTAMDHVNLRYPEDELEAALKFYCQKLGFDAELVAYDEDGNPYVDHPSHFSVRFSDNSLIHMTPSSNPKITNRYKDGERTSFDHVGILVDESIDSIKQRLVDNDIPIEREFEPNGANGVAPAVFVLDPFGYMIEIKEDPARYAERNEAIWERHQAGDDHADIAAEFDTTEAAVGRVVTYREAGSGQFLS